MVNNYSELALSVLESLRNVSSELGVDPDAVTFGGQMLAPPCVSVMILPDGVPESERNPDVVSASVEVYIHNDGDDDALASMSLIMARGGIVKRALVDDKFGLRFKGIRSVEFVDTTGQTAYVDRNVIVVTFAARVLI